MSDIFYWKSVPGLSASSALPTRQSIFDHHEQLVNKFFDEFWGNRKNFIHSNTSYPKMDIYEDDIYFCIACSVPGVEEEDLDLETVSETRLFTIRGKSCLVRPNKHFDHLKELKLSAFTRTIQLPDYIILDPEIVHLRNGILHLAFKKIVPKEEKQEETVMKISIKKL
jgi:HSP20 family molecular chaperone IbpA